MISLILYGRNDNHGYNLHKRAAISLNAMAEVLSEPDDEILFVDYNTPDDLPSFPEAIADTLTDRAKERLRVLRARPSVHAPYRSRTHLLALESISRNIALRRSNPNNRWVLSTNTDMIFVPRKPEQSLSDIVRDLPDGFYQLPRFELPEVLWESFDRRDGPGMIARTREWAQRFHLNEIVYGSPEILYDGPGDFQLCRRSDLIGIHGFHEGMLRGWHVDANLCARMRLLYGEISSAVDHLHAYHCDHTRQATAAHTHDRVENDAEEFTRVVQPQLLEQADTWGLPDEQIEEIRLGRADVFSRYLRALESAIPDAQSQIYESAYREDSYGALTYRRAHVLPFVMDLVAPFQQTARIFYAGARQETLADLSRALKSMGRAPPLTPEGMDWLKVEGVEALPVGDALEKADLLIFEFGVGEPDERVDHAMMNMRLARVRRAFIAAGANEQLRLAQGRARRRVVAVNAIHNDYESLIMNHLSFTLTPFSSRVRHGYFLSENTSGEASFDVRSVWRDVGQQTGRVRALPLWETQELTKFAVQVAGAPDAPVSTDALASAEFLIPFLRHARVTQASGIEQDAALAAAERLERERPGAGLRKRIEDAGLLASERRHALSRAADSSDWEKPSFMRFVAHHFGGARAYGFPDRNLWTWTRATLLDVLSEEGVLTPTARVLLVTPHPDPLGAAIADYVGRVEVARLGPPAGARFIGARGANEPDPQGHEAGLASWSPEQSKEPFDAVVFVQDAIMAHGRAQVAMGVSEAANLVRPGGVVTFNCTLTLLGEARGSDLTAAPLADGSFEADLKEYGSHVDFCGPLESRLTMASLDRVIDHQRGDLRYRNLLTVEGDRIKSAGVLTFRRAAAASPKSPATPLSDDEAIRLRDRSPVAHMSNKALAKVIASDLIHLSDYRYREFVNFARNKVLKILFGSRLARNLVSRMKFRARVFALRPGQTWSDAPERWSDRLVVRAGISHHHGVFEAPQGFDEGHAVYGPYLPLASGEWVLRFKATAHGGSRPSASLIVDVTQAGAELALRRYSEADLDGREHTIPFTAMSDFLYDMSRNIDLLRIETRFAPRGGAAVKIWDVRMEPASKPPG